MDQGAERTTRLYQGLTIALTIVSIALWVASNFVTVFGQDIGMISFVPIALAATASVLVFNTAFARPAAAP